MAEKAAKSANTGGASSVAGGNKKPDQLGALDEDDAFEEFETGKRFGGVVEWVLFSLLFFFFFAASFWWWSNCGWGNVL